MNIEKQTIEIAELCGWKSADHADVIKLTLGWTMPEKWCMNPKGVLQFNQHRPCYTSDLNAMHEAEGFMSNSQKQRYVTLLFQLYKTADGERDVTGVAPGIGWYPVHASASQRAEAFLRVMGKWKDGE